MRVKWVCKWDTINDCLKLIPIAEHAPDPKVYVIQDTMDATPHPITGKMMDSKSAFRHVTRANGCREVGNDAPTTTREYEPVGIKQDLLRAWEQCASKR